MLGIPEPRNLEGGSREALELRPLKRGRLVAAADMDEEGNAKSTWRMGPVFSGGEAFTGIARNTPYLL